MSIKFQNKNYVLIDDAFIAQGGQAKVYGFDEDGDDIVLKIYHERKNVLSEKKFNELKALKSEPGIVSPIDYAYESNKKIGYGMPWVKNVIPWAQMLSNGFWKENNYTTKVADKTVDSLRKIFITVHNCDNIIAIGDPNEFNFLVDERSYKAVYAIDVDAWGTTSSKVSAVAPGVRDVHSNGFNHGTDWFGWGIITFMLYTGTSPYRGRHKDFGRNIIERMKANVSMYNKEVKPPPNTRPIGEIPSGLSAWYEAVFEKGERCAPPEQFGKAKGTIAVQTVLSKKLTITVEKTFPKNIRKIYGQGLVALEDELDYISLNGKKYEITLENNVLTICNLRVAASKYIIVDDAIYTFFEGKVNKVNLIAMNGNVVAAIGNSWKVLPNSTVLFEGLLLSNILGTPYLYLPDIDSLHRFKVDELSGYKIANARRIGVVTIIVGYKKGEGYKRFIFNVNKNFTSYEAYTADVSNTDINFCMLSSGVYLILNDQDILEVRHIRKGSTCTEVKDTGLPNGSQLASMDQKALIYVNNEVKRIRLNL